MTLRRQINSFLAELDLEPPGAALPASAASFRDGGQFRIEIPSTEGPNCLDAVVAEAKRLDVPIHRVSQGSGVFMLTDVELAAMATLAAQAEVEVSLFARPQAAWGLSSAARANAVFAGAWGSAQLVANLEECVRAAAFGFRSVLIADLGVLDLFRRARARGLLPEDMQAKVSVMLPATNAAAARILEELGASTINVPTDLPLAEIAGIRAAVTVPLDIYVEAPDNVGGFVRLHDIPELVRVAAPVYLKFGVRNAPDVYPSGSHTEAAVVALARERVRRARLGLELLERSGLPAEMSPVGAAAANLAIPSPTHVNTHQ